MLQYEYNEVPCKCLVHAFRLFLGPTCNRHSNNWLRLGAWPQQSAAHWQQVCHVSSCRWLYGLSTFLCY